MKINTGMPNNEYTMYIKIAINFHSVGTVRPVISFSGNYQEYRKC